MLDLFLLTFLVIQTTMPVELLLMMKLAKGFALLYYQEENIIWMLDRKYDEHRLRCCLPNGYSKWHLLEASLSGSEESNAPRRLFSAGEQTLSLVSFYRYFLFLEGLAQSSFPKMF